MTSGEHRVPAGGPRLLRGVLGAVGVALLGVGVVGLVTTLGPMPLIGLLGWLAAAVALHDGVLVPLTHAVGRPLRRVTASWRPASAAVLRAGLVVGALLGAITVVLVRAQQVSATASLLTANYLLDLGVIWCGLAVVVGLAVAGIEARGRSRRVSADDADLPVRKRSAG